MAQRSVELQGARDFRRALKKLQPATERALREELLLIGERVALVGARNAPRDSGALQRSIRPFVTSRNVSVGSRLPYANVVHWGGTIDPRGTPITFESRPFLSDALDDTVDWAAAEVGQAFDRAVRRSGWDRPHRT